MFFVYYWVFRYYFTWVLLTCFNRRYFMFKYCSCLITVHARQLLFMITCVKYIMNKLQKIILPILNKHHDTTWKTWLIIHDIYLITIMSMLLNYWEILLYGNYIVLLILFTDIIYHVILISWSHCWLLLLSPSYPSDLGNMCII